MKIILLLGSCGFRFSSDVGAVSLPLCTAVSMTHHVGSTTTGRQHSDFAMYHGHRNLMWTFTKKMPVILI